MVTLWLFNIAMENPKNKWRLIAGKIIYFYGPLIYHGYISHNQMEHSKFEPLKIPLSHLIILVG